MRLNAWQPSKRMTELSIAELNKRLFSSRPAESDYPFETLLIVIGYSLDRDKTWVLAHPEHNLSEQLQQEIEYNWRLICQGMPLPFITGKQAFYGLEFFVNKNVLIPRPETELLVEVALQWLKSHPFCRRTIDVGTGSGIIAIILAQSFSDLTIVASDVSEHALAIAQKNALLHQVENQITFVQSDVFDSIPQKFDLVCANLPYIPSQKLDTINSIKYEPVLALDGGGSGLLLIEKLITQLRTHLAKPGLALFEIEETLGQNAVAIAKTTFPDATISIHKDLAGKDRLLSLSLD